MRGNRKRKHRVEVAMNDQEYEVFLNHVKKCGMTKQTYLLFLIKDRIPQPRPSEDFQEVIRQLRRIGTNINQIAHVCNARAEVTIFNYENLTRLQSQLLKKADEVYQVLREAYL